MDSEFIFEEFLISLKIKRDQLDKHGRTPIFYFFCKINGTPTTQFDPIENFQQLLIHGKVDFNL